MQYISWTGKKYIISWWKPLFYWYMYVLITWVTRRETHHSATQLLTSHCTSHHSSHKTDQVTLGSLSNKLNLLCINKYDWLEIFECLSKRSVFWWIGVATVWNVYEPNNGDCTNRVLKIINIDSRHCVVHRPISWLYVSSEKLKHWHRHYIQFLVFFRAINIEFKLL